MAATICIPWTAAELVYLRSHYARTPIAELIQHLGRTKDQIRHKAQDLGIKTGRSLTPAQEARLREAWGNVPTRELARELGCTANAVKQKALKRGLDSNRYYTEAEKDLVRSMYATHSAPEIAERLHGNRKAAMAVWQLARRLGLRKLASHAPEVLDQVRAWHAQGLTDVGIAVQIGLDRDQVKHIRAERLHLPANMEAAREACKGSWRKQLVTMGAASMGEVRTQAYRKYAVENGWPANCRPREVQVLNVLAAAGVPLTMLEISERIGMRTDKVNKNGSRPLLTGNGKGGTYTASLARRGLVTRLRLMAPPRPGNKKRRDLYCLGPGALAILERRAAECKSEKA